MYHSMFVIYLHSICRLFLNPYLSCFLYVCSVCLRRPIFQVIKKKKKQFICFSFKINSKNNFTILRSVFYSTNVCVSNRNIYISYIHTVAYVSFPSCLNREDQYVVSFSIFLITRSTNWKNRERRRLWIDDDNRVPVSPENGECHDANNFRCCDWWMNLRIDSPRKNSAFVDIHICLPVFVFRLSRKGMRS